MREKSEGCEGGGSGLLADLEAAREKRTMLEPRNSEQIGFDAVRALVGMISCDCEKHLVTFRRLLFRLLSVVVKAGIWLQNCFWSA